LADQDFQGFLFNVVSSPNPPKTIIGNLVLYISNRENKQQVIGFFMEVGFKTDNIKILLFSHLY